MAVSIEEIVGRVKSERIEKREAVPVFDLTGDATELLPPGSGMLIVAPEGSEAFAQLKRAVASRDKGTIDSTTIDLKPRILNRKQRGMDDAVDAFKASSCVVDLYYGRKQLVANAFQADGSEVTRVLFSFVGGSFEPADFQAMMYLDSDRAQPLQAMVVVHEPKVSDREKAILLALPEESRSMLFGAADPVMATPAALIATITVGIIVAGVGTALTACVPHHVGIENIILPADLQEGSSLAVVQLLAARREALGRPL